MTFWWGFGIGIGLGALVRPVSSLVRGLLNRDPTWHETRERRQMWIREEWR